MTQKALRFALEALDNLMYWDNGKPEYDEARDAITAIKEALAQPDEQLLISNILSHYGLQAIDFVADFKKAMKQAEQKPVALPCCGYADASAIKWNPHNQVVQCHNCGQVYTATPQRKPLTDEKIDAVTDSQWAKGVNKPIYAAHRAYARAIEVAHGIKENT